MPEMPPGEPTGPPRGLDEVYDEATLAAIDGSGPVRAPQPGPTAGGLAAWRLGGAITVAALGGVADAVGASRPEPEVAWYTPTGPTVAEGVAVLLVPGNPAASHIVVSPWLVGGRGRR